MPDTPPYPLTMTDFVGWYGRFRSQRRERLIVRSRSLAITARHGGDWMLHRPRRMLGGMLTLGAVLIATIAAPGAALASSTPPTFNVVMGETCVSGAASPSTSFTLRWKNKSGSLVTRQTVTVDHFGDWSACSSGHVATD